MKYAQTIDSQSSIINPRTAMLSEIQISLTHSNVAQFSRLGEGARRCQLCETKPISALLGLKMRVEAKNKANQSQIGSAAIGSEGGSLPRRSGRLWCRQLCETNPIFAIWGL